MYVGLDGFVLDDDEGYELSGFVHSVDGDNVVSLVWAQISIASFF